MQMFANDPQYIVEDMLKGYAKAHSDIVAPHGQSQSVQDCAARQRGQGWYRYRRRLRP